jgi:hypothetical protein
MTLSNQQIELLKSKGLSFIADEIEQQNNDSTLRVARRSELGAAGRAFLDV